MFAGRFIEKNNWEPLLKDMLKKQYVLNVGILGPEAKNGKGGAVYPDEGNGSSGGKSVAQVAYENEYGDGKKPARPFMRNTAARKQEEWQSIMRHAVENNGLDVKDALEMLGEVVEKDIVQTIEEGVPPPSSPATVAAKKAKGRADPGHTLVDSGFMQEHISHEVTEDDGRN